MDKRQIVVTHRVRIMQGEISVPAGLTLAEMNQEAWKMPNGAYYFANEGKHALLLPRYFPVVGIADEDHFSDPVWGVKRHVMGTANAEDKWYSNERHTRQSALDLAASYNEAKYPGRMSQVAESFYAAPIDDTY